MLNRVQKNFRKQMKSLNKENENYDDIYRSPRKSSFKKKHVFIISSPIILILFLLTFSSLPVKIINDYQVNKDRKMNDYLQSGFELEQKSNLILHNIVSGVQNGNLTSQSIRVALVEMELYKTKLTNLKEPKGFKEYHQLFEEVFDEQISLLKLVEVSLNTNSLNNSQLQYYIQNINDKNTIKKLTLIKVFEAEKIKYEELNDGTLRYWYKTN